MSRRIPSPAASTTDAALYATTLPPRRSQHQVAFLSLALLGAAGFGAVRPAAAQTYTLTTLATFPSTGGISPFGGVTLDSSGNLYGTTSGGGFGLAGTVFEITPGVGGIGRGAFTTLASFTNDTYPNGDTPRAGVAVDNENNLYGTASGGGSALGYGTVYKIGASTAGAGGTVNPGTLSVLATFIGPNGDYPVSNLTFDSKGDLYGTTELGGNSTSEGTVFEIAARSNALTTLATFSGANGANPFGGIALDSKGNLYGTTEGGGSGISGTVFEIAAGTNTMTTLADFNGANGQVLYSGVTLDSSGNIYGTTFSGGANDDGTVYEIAAGTNTVTTLAAFNSANGANPYAGLTLDSSGNLFGTTVNGGLSGDGTVFEIAVGAGGVIGTGGMSVLENFNGANGANPYAGVTLDGSGNLYGTTEGGGPNGYGTVFTLSPNAAASAPEPAALVLLL